MVAKFGQPLTPLDIDTMKQLSMGVNAKRIARQQGVKLSAIRTRMWRMSVKLGTRGHIQTIMLAYRLGYFDLPPVDDKLIHTSCGG
jgi:DNA-binding NarL/FixJ family response regulator